MRVIPYIALLDESYWGYFGIKLMKNYTEDNKMDLLWILPKMDAEIAPDSKGGQEDWKVWYRKVIDINDIDVMSDGNLFQLEKGIREEVLVLISNTLANQKKAEQSF